MWRLLSQLNLKIVPKTVKKNKQGNTKHSLNQAAATAINRHERKHAKLAKSAFDTFAKPLKKRMENYMGQEKGYKSTTAADVKQCIEELKKIIRFQDTVNKINHWITELGKELDAPMSADGQSGGDGGYNYCSD